MADPAEYVDVDKAMHIMQSAGQMLFASKLVATKGQLDLEECNEWTNTKLRESWNGVAGNQSDTSLVSWADAALLLEAVMRRCGELLEARYDAT